jgi:predicted nucleic acid-binding protein
LALILDTGALLAAMDRSDRDHPACAQLLTSTDEQLVIPGPILPELDYWFHKGMGPDALTGLLSEIAAGVFHVEELKPTDYQRVADLLERYIDLRVGFVDAAVLAIVERLAEPKLATLDRRHFSIMSPRHVDTLELLPASIVGRRR